MPQLEIINYYSLLIWFYISYITFYFIYKEYILLVLNDWWLIINKIIA